MCVCVCVCSEEGDITTEEALAEKERDFNEVNDKYLKSIKMSGTF